MQYRIDHWIKTLNDLRSQGAKFLTLNSLARATKMKKASLRVALWRLTKKRLIYKIGKWYAIPPVSLEEAAAVIYPPCYFSLEWALFKYSIIDQAPYVCTCVTLKKPKKVKTPLGVIEYKHIRRNLFFGYNDELFAYPEKAILDLIYFKRHSGITINFELLNIERLKEFAERYPKTVRKELENTIKEKT